MSRNLARFHHLPTPKELTGMKEDLAFKDSEMKKSQSTTSGLAGESEKLHQDLQKVEQLEAKITQELDMLKNKIETMTTELETFSNLDKLKVDAEVKKKRLGEDKVVLHKRRDSLKKQVQTMSQQYEGLKTQLNENETFAQLQNLERKWQHHEQNNFVMKEFIAAKTMESDFRPMARRVSSLITELNQKLQDQLSGKSAM